MKRKITKKNVKRILYLLFYVASLVISTYWGNFSGQTSSISKTNPFTHFLGVTSVEIDPNYTPTLTDNYTTIEFRLKNTGDKKVNDLYLTYEFCNEPIKTVDLEFNSLETGETLLFKTQTKNKVNSSCTPTINITIAAYKDSSGRFYCDEKNVTAIVCTYCITKFQVYGNGKLLKNSTIKYPLVEGGVEMRTTDTNCLPIPKNISGLQQLEPITFFIWDASSSCRQGKYPEWCAKNIYTEK